MEKMIKVNLLEKITLNEINKRNETIELSNLDCILSITKRIQQLTPETSLEELKNLQEQLRAMLNQSEKELKIIEKDKLFIQKIMERKNEI